MHRIVFILLCFISLVQALGQTTDVIVPGDNLVIDGIPPIPKSIADEVARYTEFRSAGLLAWHPSNRTMLISTRFAETAQIHLVTFPGGARRQLTFFPDRINGASYSRTRTDFFLFSKDVGGGEWFQNYRYDVATGDVTLLTDGKSRNSPGLWSNSGDRIVYTSTRRNNKDTDFYILDPSNPKSDRLLAQVTGGGWNPMDWSPDDRTILALEYISINESYIWTIDVVSGEMKLLTPKTDEKIARAGALYTRDGKGLYVVSDRGSEFKQLVHVDLATQKHTPLTGHISWDVNEFTLSQDGTMLAFVTNENGISVLHVLDTRSWKEIPLPKIPTGIIGSIQWHAKEPLLGFNLTSARATADVYSIDVRKRSLDRWTYSETGGLNTENFSEPKLIKWTTFDGMEISGFLYEPPSRFTGKRPVIVNIHGGPESQARPGFQGRNNYYLNEMGVAMIFPNIRGSSGYGKTFLTLDNGMKREDSYKDLASLLDWIKRQPNLDGDRIMVTGGSYGGHSTLAVATFHADKIACAVDVVGMSNLVTFLENTESYRRDLRRAEYGDERNPEMRAFLERIAPLNNADKITKPLFVVQGKNDPRVPASEAEQIVATLKKSNTPVWYLLANDEGHGFAKRKNQDFQFYATVMFVRTYLLDNGMKVN
jgi:dipeptidyl aminopeptidase/acylaminoacyl peptidase